MAAERVVFDEWAPGVAGSGSPIRGEDRTGTYRGRNAQVARNGTLVPRPGWKLLGQSGADFVTSTDTPRGILWRRDATGGTNQGTVLFVYESGANTYIEEGALDASGTTITWGGKLTRTTANFPVLSNGLSPTASLRANHWMWYDGVETTIIGGEIFENFDTSSPTSYHHTYSGTNYASGATLYRERAYFFGYANFPGRIYYSDPADYATVGASSYFDVSPDPSLASAAVIGCWSVNNALLIARRDGRWFVLTGASPENGTLREMADSTVPYVPHGALLMEDTLFYASPDGLGIDLATPGEVDTESLEHLTPFEIPRSWSAGFYEQEPTEAAGDKINGYAMWPVFDNPDGTTGTNGVLDITTRINGSFGYEQYSSDTDTTTDHDSVSLSNGPFGRVFLFTEQGTTWEFLVRNYTLDAPVDTTFHNWSAKPTANQASNSLPAVYLPQILAPPGQLVRLVGFEIDYDYVYYAGGTMELPQINVTPYTLGVDSDTSPRHQGTAVNTDAVTDGWTATSQIQDPLRRRFSSALVNEPYGGAVELYFTFASVYIHRITLEIELTRDTA